MKKIFLLLTALVLSLGAFAQKGQQAVGLNVTFGGWEQQDVADTNFGFGAKYQYWVTNHIRLEGAVNYDLRTYHSDLLYVGANGHYLFNLSRKFTLYPIVGVGYAYRSASSEDWEDGGSRVDTFKKEGVEYEKANSRVYVNAGLGGELALGSHWAISLEFKYQWIKDFSRMPFQLGVSYKF